MLIIFLANFFHLFISHLSYPKDNKILLDEFLSFSFRTIEKAYSGAKKKIRVRIVGIVAVSVTRTICGQKLFEIVWSVKKNQKGEKEKKKRNSVGHAAGMRGEMTKQGRDTEIPGIKHESQKDECLWLLRRNYYRIKRVVYEGCLQMTHDLYNR